MTGGESLADLRGELQNIVIIMSCHVLSRAGIAQRSEGMVGPTGVKGRHVYANAFDDPSCYIDLFR